MVQTDEERLATSFHYDEIFGTGNATNPTVVSVAVDKLSMVVSSAVTIETNTTLKFVGSVDPTDTFVVAETVTFYDDGAKESFSETNDS